MHHTSQSGGCVNCTERDSQYRQWAALDYLTKRPLASFLLVNSHSLVSNGSATGENMRERCHFRGNYSRPHADGNHSSTE